MRKHQQARVERDHPHHGERELLPSAVGAEHQGDRAHEGRSHGEDRPCHQGRDDPEEQHVPEPEAEGTGPRQGAVHGVRGQRHGPVEAVVLGPQRRIGEALAPGAVKSVGTSANDASDALSRTRYTSSHTKSPGRLLA